MQEFKDARARGKRKFSKKEFKLFRRELESLTKLEPERKKKAWYYIGILIQFFATIVWTFSTTVLDHEWISINQVLLLLSSPVMLLFIVNYLCKSRRFSTPSIDKSKTNFFSPRLSRLYTRLCWYLLIHQARYMVYLYYFPLPSRPIQVLSLVAASHPLSEEEK